VDFNKLFAVVAHKDTVRLFESIVNHCVWQMNQVDSVAAFLSEDFEGTFYMELPEGSGIPDSKAL
jgi:hypothetical protein